MTGVRRTWGLMRAQATSTSVRLIMGAMLVDQRLVSWRSADLRCAQTHERTGGPRSGKTSAPAANLDVAEVVVEVGRAGARVLGGLVEAAQADRLGVQRIGAERRDLVGRHQPAL